MIGFQPDPPLRRVRLGQLAITPDAAAALEEAGQTLAPYLTRHLRGDWGDLDPDDKARNDRALAEGGRLLSVYTLSTGQRIYLITEPDFSVTTALLPSEY